MKTKIFFPALLTIGLMAAACGDQKASNNLDMIAAQQMAAQRSNTPNTVTVTQNNTTTVIRTATVSTTETSVSTVTATVRE